MDIALLYFEHCPNWKIADERLSALAAERPELRVTPRLVDTPAEAKRAGSTAHPASTSTEWTSSPHPTPRSGCPVAGTPHRTGEGAPTLEQLRAVLADA
ncbi:MAG: thioredoxin family protein [Ornithinimicrobium sp.]